MVCDSPNYVKPSKVVVTINNPLADLFIHQTFPLYSIFFNWALTLWNINNNKQVDILVSNNQVLQILYIYTMHIKLET